MNDEIWKDIKDYEGLYQVSNYGRIKSLSRLLSDNRIWKEKILKQSKSKGYLKVLLSKDTNQKTFRISRLVAQAFIPNPNNYPEVNHKNGIKTNNYVDNLEWCTSKENTIHARINNLCNQNGENSVRAKLTNQQAEEIRNLIGKMKQYKIAEKYNVVPAVISRIKNNKIYVV